MKNKICFIITVLIFGIVAHTPAHAVIATEDLCCEYEDFGAPDSPTVCRCYGVKKNGKTDCGVCDGLSGNCIETPWAIYNTGYQKRTVCSIDGTASTRYRCDINYYGTSSNGTSGCTPCPQSGKSDAGSISITSCYLPSGGGFSDSTGSGTYTGNCYYSN